MKQIANTRDTVFHNQRKCHPWSCILSFLVEKRKSRHKETLVGSNRTKWHFSPWKPEVIKNVTGKEINSFALCDSVWEFPSDTGWSNEQPPIPLAYHIFVSNISDALNWITLYLVQSVRPLKSQLAKVSYIRQERNCQRTYYKITGEFKKRGR